MMTDHQLDIWAEIIYDEADNCSKIMDEAYVINDTRYLLAKGRRDGLIGALTWLGTIEEGKRFRKRIAEIESKTTEGE